MKQNKGKKFFGRSAYKATLAMGSTAIIMGFSLIVFWAISGPLFNCSEIWQLIINTGTTIITYLMVILIQKSQNKDTIALHTKLNELVAANETTGNRLVDAEGLSEEELLMLKKYYERLKERQRRRIV